MIPNRDGWNYLAIKKMSVLFRGIMVQQKTNLNHIKAVCKNKYFCGVKMPSEETKILEFNQYQESDKAPFIFYADLESLIEKIDGYKNNPENSSTAKVDIIVNIPSMSTI